MSESKRILLIIGGGIAAYKSLFLIRRLAERGVKTRAILTAAGAEFVTPLSVSALTGDTVFPGSCGRLDLPGSSTDAMFESLQHLREALDDALPLFPGHAYSGASSTVAQEKAAGLLRPLTKSQWRRMMTRSDEKK